jgi:hypothetical protein
VRRGGGVGGGGRGGWGVGAGDSEAEPAVRQGCCYSCLPSEKCNGMMPLQRSIPPWLLSGCDAVWFGFVTAGLSELDGISLIGGSHSSACFTAGCMDNTPTK